LNPLAVAQFLPRQQIQHQRHRTQPELVRRYDRAAILIEAPGQCGETGVTYLPAVKRYVMAAWYYPTGNGHAGKIEATEFAFYESAKSWGPWTKIRQSRSSHRAGISREYWPNSNRRQVGTFRLLSPWPETGEIPRIIATPWYRLDF
jgi:hypothetical protein